MGLADSEGVAERYVGDLLVVRVNFARRLDPRE